MEAVQPALLPVNAERERGEREHEGDAEDGAEAIQLGVVGRGVVEVKLGLESVLKCGEWVRRHRVRSVAGGGQAEGDAGRNECEVREGVGKVSCESLWGHSATRRR